MSEPFRVAVIYFNPPPGEERWRRLLDGWLTLYDASGTSLPLAILTDEATAFEGTRDVCRVPDSGGDLCGTPLNKAGWLRANAFSLLGPCAVIEADAQVRRPIDHLADLRCPMAMGADPANRTHPGWPEASPEMNSGVMVFRRDVRDDYQAVWRVRRPCYGSIPFFDELVFTDLWRRAGGSTLAREDNWSHWWGPNPEARVLHSHGTHKWAEPGPT